MSNFHEAPPAACIPIIFENNVKTHYIGHNNVQLDAPVSVVKIGNNEYLYCNYRNVFFVSKNDGNNFDAVKVSTEGLLPTQLWVPTGLFWHNNFLYVANYTGNNILVFIFDKYRKTLIKQQEICHTALISPENIFVNEDIIATANYDGNSVTVFNHSGQLLWEASVKLAHGVSADKNYVYVTGLGNRGVYKFDYAGNLIRKIERRGFKRNEYAWPTSIAVLSDESLLITDAHNGRLTRIDKNLNYLSDIGINGSAENMFNFPYAAIETENGFVIADTFKSRLIFTNSDFAVTEQVYLEQKLAKNMSRSSVKYKTDDPYLYDLPAEGLNTIFKKFIPHGSHIVSSYGGFKILDSSNRIKRSIRIQSLPSAGYFYITMSQNIILDTITLTVIFSPQLSTILVIDEKTKAFAAYDICLDIWNINSCNDINNFFTENAVGRNFLTLREALNNGDNPAKAYEEVFKNSKNSINNLLEFITFSEAGKQFKAGLRENQSMSSLYSRYLNDIVDVREIFLLEYIAVSYLAGNHD
jgi:DNA-binding beta-propeller fold protein YncE